MSGPARFGRAWLGLAYVPSGRPERSAELAQADVDAANDQLALARSNLVLTN